jgi:prepilin-type N-terminal cleavage/methylation domain-containing protein
MLTERRGFTLIELLIVTVIIGILAAIAIPTFVRSKDKAYVATMKSDLRNLVTAQEAYFVDAITYYDGALPSAQFSYNPSSGVSITLSNVTGGGWAAVTSHVQLGETCAMFMGTAPATAPATTEGRVACS